MPKLLQSRLPLACTLAALLLVWLGDLLSQTGKAAAGKATNPKLSEDPIPSHESTDIEASTITALNNWIQLHLTDPLSQRADPFEYPETTPAPAPTSTPPPVDAAPSASTLIPPIVRAISIGSGKPLAVLDGSVVGEGDLLGTWRIDKIDPEGVSVSGAHGQLRLRLERVAVAATPPANTGTPGKPQSVHTTRSSDNASRTP